MESGLGISDISVVMPTNWKRRVEIETILAHLKSLGFEDIILAEGKKRMYNRYEAVKEAKNPIIYTQDDDCIIYNIQALIEAYEQDRIIANTKLDRFGYYERICEGKIALVGFGSLFHKDLVKNLKPYLDKYGEDETFYREADRAFTWLNKKELVIADKAIQDFPSSMEGISMDSDHFTSMYIMIDRLKQL